MVSAESPARRFRTGMGLGLAFLIGLLTFFITFQVLNGFRVPADERLDPPEKRPAAGDLTYAVLNADATGTGPDTWTLEGQQGKVVIVNYFATWCGPCLREMPDLTAIAQEYASRGVVMVAVSVDRDNEAKEGITRLQALQEFTKSRTLPFPILLPAENSALMKMSFPIPQTLLYDRHGRRARLIAGAIDKASVKRSLDELLKEN